MQELFKYIIEEIKLIECLSKTKITSVKIGNEAKNFKGYLRKLKPKGFLLEVNSKDQLAPNMADEISGSLLSNKAELKILDAYLMKENFSHSKKPFYFKSQIHIRAFQKGDFEKSHKGFYRNIIPIDSGMNFYYKVEDKTFRHDGGVRTRGLVEVIVDSKTLHAFLVKINTISYLIIDCLNEITFVEFSEYYWSFTISLGYITGYLAQNEVYTFCYEDQSLRGYSSFSYSQTRDTIVNRYCPVYTNPFAWIKSDKDVVGKFEKKLQMINSSQLSSLCQIIHHENDIKAIILLITEALKSSLLLMPAGLSVALEGLSEFFAFNNPSRLKPISDPAISKSFRNDLATVLEKYNNSHAFEGYEILKKKIMEINSPTNREKLKTPFIILNIRLTKIDEETIEHRNDFLHGNINLKPRRPNKSYKMDNNEISLRLITLLNMVLMKMCDYTGYIVNYVKVQEWGMDKTINEEYFREI